ncbi:MAG: hypothetical protein OXG54_05445 [Gammaproteobacteria bacterium]|nr:hypothetical protein [Gammaproteobacteria bacterium]
MDSITIIVTVISANIALAGLIVTGQNSLRREMREQREDMQAEFKITREAIGHLRERMAHLEGLIDGLREAITGRRVAEDPGAYRDD